MHSVQVRTRQRNAFLEITDEVRRIVHDAKLTNGLCVVYCPHTTAAITVNENADPDVVHDMLAWLGKAIPQEQREFRHGEGNSDSHLKASLVGPSVTLLVENSALVLGRWQGVYFCEFDGPRTRTVHVQTLAGS
jgi:secondary thiamine-phosphate synthase enzyme